MPTWVRFDDSSKKWQYSTNQGANWYDLVANALLETIDFQSVASPGTDYTMHKDSTSLHLVLELPSGKAFYIKDGDLVVDGSFTLGDTEVLGRKERHGASYVDPNGISTVPTQVMAFFSPIKACTITGAWGRISNGTSIVMNVYQWTAPGYIRSSNITINSTTWQSFGTLQNTALAAGTTCFLLLSTPSGSPQVASVLIEVQY
jgi:hypothetical protein